MSSARPSILQAGVASKSRCLFCDVVVSATISLPVFPTGPDSDGRMVFAGDMRGCEVGDVHIDVSNWDSLTSLDFDIETSDDGVDWDVWKSSSQFTGNGHERIYAKAADGGLSSFIRATITQVGVGTATVAVHISHNVVGSKGRLAPPGQLDFNT